MKFQIKNQKVALETLPFEGSNSLGDSYQITNQYMMKNGKAILPIMGEFHYSRYQDNEWEEEICKMKAGGVQIISTYCIWIHLEEREGEWDFSGSRDLKKFVELCKKHDMLVWLRIGPWVHGAVRNGGYPDWLSQRDFDVRSNDPKYLEKVKLLYIKLYEQVKGMLWKEDGPIIGIQLDNEFGPCGPSKIAKDPVEGPKHIMNLKLLAKEVGFEVPFYTVTGWSSSPVVHDETIPVLGSYVDAPWARHKEKQFNENFMFYQYKNDDTIGCDFFNHEEKVTIVNSYDVDHYPYMTCETGSGLQVTSHRRAVPSGIDIEAQIICQLGSGSNLIGYYMYHGGTNPDGKYSTFQESRDTGYANDFPIKSYDFQAALRESGEKGRSFGRINKVHTFISCFEEMLAKSYPYFPVQRPTGYKDIETMRTSIRYNEETQEGFLFINNHQRFCNMNPIVDETIEIELGNEIIKLTPINLESDEVAILPFNFKMGASVLKFTNASILGKFGNIYYFYTDKEPFYDIDGDMPGIVTLSVADANNSYVFDGKLYISEGLLYQEGNEIVCVSKNPNEIVKVYDADGTYETIQFKNEQQYTTASFELKKQEQQYQVYEINVGNIEANAIEKSYLEINYLGDKAEIYINGHLTNDWFTMGENWNLNLTRLGYPEVLELRVYPTIEDIYYDIQVEAGCELVSTNVLFEYKNKVKVEKGCNCEG